MGSLRCDLAPCGSSGLFRVASGSLGVAEFIGVRPGGRRVRSRSMGSLRCALGVVEFIRGGWVHWGAPWRSLNSFGERLGGSQGSLGSFGCALGVRSGSLG